MDEVKRQSQIGLVRALHDDRRLVDVSLGQRSNILTTSETTERTAATAGRSKRQSG
jgi:hypothetical protein